MKKKQLNKWQCDICGDKYKTKTELVEDLKDHLADAEQEEEIAHSQLDDLGIKNHY